MHSAIREPKSGADNKIFDRTRDEHFARGRGRRYTRGDVHGDAAGRAVVQIDLSGVQTRTDLEPEAADPFNYRPRAAYPPRRTIECGFDPVACRLVQPAAMPVDLLPRQLVVPIE